MKQLTFLALSLVFLTLCSGCVVSEGDFQAVETERDELKKELLKAREENTLLNQSMLEAYQEMEKLTAQIDKLEKQLKKRNDEAKKAVEDAGKPKVYVVKSGDTLKKVSDRTGVSIERIKSLNKIRSDGMLWIGQKLRLR